MNFLKNLFRKSAPREIPSLPPWMPLGGTRGHSLFETEEELLRHKSQGR